MSVYQYRAVDESGNTHQGTMEEASAFRVTSILRERGLEVNEVNVVAARRVLPFAGAGLRWSDLSLFNDYLLATVKSGLPLAPALKALGEDLHRSPLRSVLEDVRARIERGETLEAALSAHPQSFPQSYLAAIRAGEQTGNLTGVLQHLSAHASRMTELNARIREAMAYPVLIIIACIGVFSFLMLEVVPVYRSVFMDFGARLPWLTQFFIDLSDFMKYRYGTFFVVIALVAVAGKLLERLIVRSERGSFIVDRILLSLWPGRARYYGVVAEFNQSFGLLLSSRVPMVESIDLAAAASRSAVLRFAVRKAAQHIVHGMTLRDSLKNTGFFDPFYVWMVGVAEERGELDTAVITLAETYQERMDKSTALFLKFLGPAVIIATGLVVASVVVSLYLPIFSLGDVISGN